jgi:hypothetical protein
VSVLNLLSAGLHCCATYNSLSVCAAHVLQVPLQLYKEAMVGVRKYLLRHIYDGTAHMSFVSEAHSNGNSVGPTNDRFEHLTCFAGGMFLLGE